MALTRVRARTRTLWIGIVAVLLAVTAVVTLQTPASAAPARPANPPTTIASASAALSDASRKAEKTAEAFNLATIKLAAANKAAADARRAALQADARYDQRRGQMTHLVRARYEGDSFGTAAALLDSRNAGNLMTRMGTLNLVSSRLGAVLAAVGEAKAAADAANNTATATLRAANAMATRAERSFTEANTSKAKFETILATLSAAQLAQYNSGTVPPAVAKATIAAGNPHLSAKQKTIVDFVESQVGKPYVFAAAGPEAYDCSGLSMVAYALVGIHLPHNSVTQYTASSNHPTSSQLQPGNLVFLYPDTGHVEIYVGNGMAVSAADEELGIRYVNVFADMGSWYGATRLL